MIKFCSLWLLTMLLILLCAYLRRSEPLLARLYFTGRFLLSTFAMAEKEDEPVILLNNDSDEESSSSLSLSSKRSPVWAYFSVDDQAHKD